MRGAMAQRRAARDAGGSPAHPGGFRDNRDGARAAPAIRAGAGGQFRDNRDGAGTGRATEEDAGGTPAHPGGFRDNRDGAGAWRAKALARPGGIDPGIPG